MKYQILIDSSPASLARTVDDFLRSGWKISGNLIAISFDDYIQFYQAIIKEDNRTPANIALRAHAENCKPEKEK